jgi:uncharacterized caspase-like protein/tetratricopeptide (TPR) repeat protein
MRNEAFVFLLACLLVLSSASAQPPKGSKFANAGDEKMSKKDFAGALDDFEKAIQASPDNEYFKLGRIKAEIGMKDYNRATAHCDELDKKNQLTNDVRIQRGIILYETNSYTNALAKFNEVIADIKGTPLSRIDIYLYRGRLYTAFGKFEEALKDFDKIVKDAGIKSYIYSGMKALKSEAHLYRAMIFYGKKDYKQAILDCDASIKDDNQNSITYLLRAKSKEASGDKDGAKADYEKADSFRGTQRSLIQQKPVQKYEVDIINDRFENKAPVQVVKNTEVKTSTKTSPVKESDKNVSARPAKVAEDLDNFTPATVRLPQIWAVVVGVSDYKQPEIQDLKFARNDAESFADFLKSPQGGSVPNERMKVLVNEKATRGNVIKAINDMFYQAFDDDMVVFYIAGHGQPDPRAGEIYFLNYDAQPENLAGTALSQMDIQKAFQNTRAKRKIWIADACHSGSVGLQMQVRAGEQSAMTNRLLNQIAETSPGMVMLTASSATEYSYEDARWGGGHGVFSYYLIEGLKGQADKDGKGVIDIREIHEYIYRQVSKDTQGQQHPELKGSFDNRMPLSVTK